ncbi:MAG: RagB/SusD family nutrient uptake outer membrane protein, partial [Tannerella sp.]|nr:RagB/SusD family nutrient uptake outer membrane protein [Tannerella sp.]
MKTIIKNTVFFICILFAAPSCDYLDVVPDDVATIEYAFKNSIAAEKYLYGCYSYKPRIGDIQADPAMTGSDETAQRYVIMLQGDRFVIYGGARLTRGEQNTNDPIMNMWDGNHSLWVGIRDCNIFLENIDGVRDVMDHNRRRWIAETKFLKAYYHYCLMKRYGPVPIIDVNQPVSVGVKEVQVYREPIDDVVDYITGLIDEAMTDLPETQEIVEGTEAGRVDKLVAMTLKAEVLLFAASPLFNGNTDYSGIVDNQGRQLFPQTYDPNKWKLAADACLAAINACHVEGKRLYNQVDPLLISEHDLIKQETNYRQAICDRWNSELIWGGTNHNYGILARDATPRIIPKTATALSHVTGEWSPTLELVNKYYSSNGVPIEEDKEWTTNGWYSNRYAIRPEPSSGDDIYRIKEGQNTVYLHFNRELRFYASIAFDKGIFFGGGYNTFRDVKHCEFMNAQVSGYKGGEANTISGYAAKKMSHYKNTQQQDQTTSEYYPFPIYRLADLYLMYAEALNEVDGPVGEIFEYLDLIRERVGLEGIEASWTKYSNNPEKINTKDGRRNIIHRERAIELALEGKRFWDIRRWKEIEVYNDDPTGWNIMGDTPEDFYNPVSLRRESVRFTAKDYFWPIKESNLFVNKNLI